MLTDITSRHSVADQQFIDGLSTRVIMDFRSSVYQPAYIAAHANIFINHEWIDIDALRLFVERAPQPELSSPPSGSPIGRVKLEHDASTTRLSSAGSISAHPIVKTRTLEEGGREVLEILSDSESDESDRPTAVSTNEDSIDVDDSSSLPASDFRSDSVDMETDFDDDTTSSDEFDASVDWKKSGTRWQDEQISSEVLVGPIRVTKEVTVQRLERLTELASVYPIPAISTGFVLDLHDPKFEIKDGEGKLYTIDALIKNKDNDSWSGNTGVADTKVFVTFEPGEPPILCRRSRLHCRGAYACERVDLALLEVERRDLDPASRDAIFAAQRQTRREEGTTAERKVAELIQVIQDQKCYATDSNGVKCNGVPILKQKKERSGGHNFWVACSGWRKDFKEKHRTWSIPSEVDENLFVKAFSGRALAADKSKDTPPCSAIVHPTTGLKRRHCPHSHIAQGKPVTSRIVNRACSATRTIYVPLDPTIRKALIVHPNNTPHNHPMPPLTKASFELKDTYRQCIKAVGCVGATVAKVDNAPSTSLLLDGRKPGEFAPALQSNQVKRKLVREVKMEAYPAGLDAAGAFKLFWDDMKKPIDERYIHRLVTMPDGGIMILTCLAALMRLLDDPGVTSFETDTTFKRVEGDINEWEVVIFLKALQRAVTIARAYVNGASAEFFERLYDEFQSVKLELTGKPVAFKRFVEGGNLLAMNSDMEAAQVLGAARSFLKTSDPDYSGISRDTPGEEVASEFVKLCVTHAKRAVLDFRSLVSEEDYNRLMDFVYIDSEEALEEFSEFVRGLGVKKIQDWWDHKEMSSWILPCLVKSQSRMSAEDWDNTPATTNTGEAQHHYTNSRTGTKLSLVEAMESGHKLDESVVREIDISIKSGVLVNPRNESYHRRSRNTTRESTTIRKSRESRALADERAQIQLEIDAEKLAQKESSARLKALQARKSENRKNSKPSKSSGSRTVVVAASSSGRVTTRTIGLQSRNPDPNPPSPPVASTSAAPVPSPSASAQGVQLPAVDQCHMQTLPDTLTTAYGHGGFLDNGFFDFGLPPIPANGLQDFVDWGSLNASWFDQFNIVPSADAFAPVAQGYPDTAGIDYGFLMGQDFQFPSPMPSSPLPRLPPVPVSSPPAPTPSPTLQPAVIVPRKRKTRDEVDPANVIHCPRARKVPKRADQI
ncbi:hypothetical protein B0H11DRAFT_2042902 [Mycena galericulata]|nr:hypothetical protein B0H11DRAFT_2042854 [Mycena galericulata]KAJ7469960.1 hypothetical protein B0H11DRAFT_2042902 [Mycena galericulata]